MNKLCRLCYMVDDITRTLECRDSLENEDLQLTFCKEETSLQILLTPKKTLTVLSASYYLSVNYTKKSVIFANGYQSWSDSHEKPVSSYDKGLQKIPDFLDRKYAFSSYGDYNFYTYPMIAGIQHSWNYTYLCGRGQLITLWGSLNENDCFTVFTHDSHKNQLTISKDICPLKLSEPLLLFSLWEKTGLKNQILQEYMTACGYEKKAIPKLYGYTSWYNYYDKINEEKILSQLQAIEGSDLFHVFQIDDGYQLHVGDWLKIDPVKFPNGLEPVIKAIHAAGKEAGIWIAPFVCETDSELYKEHPDWLAQNKDGKPIKAGHNWSHSYVLNLDHPEVRSYLTQVFQHYSELGIDFFKLDFLYAAGLSLNNNTTRARRMRSACEFLRECLPGKTILGCGVPCFSAAGLVDYCRIGCDVGPDYDNNRFMRLFHRERVSTKNTLLNTIYRSHLDGCLFGNDPDVYLLRDKLKLNRQQQEALLRINALFSSLLFTSDVVSDYSPEDQELLKEALSASYEEITYETKNERVYLTLRNGGLLTKWCFHIRSGRLAQIN